MTEHRDPREIAKDIRKSTPTRFEAWCVEYSNGLGRQTFDTREEAEKFVADANRLFTLGLKVVRVRVTVERIGEG